MEKWNWNENNFKKIIPGEPYNVIVGTKSFKQKKSDWQVSDDCDQGRPYSLTSLTYKWNTGKGTSRSVIQSPQIIQQPRRNSTDRKNKTKKKKTIQGAMVDCTNYFNTKILN